MALQMGMQGDGSISIIIGQKRNYKMLNKIMKHKKIVFTFIGALLLALGSISYIYIDNLRILYERNISYKYVNDMKDCKYENAKVKNTYNNFEVSIEEFKDTPKLAKIKSYIFVERESQKAILLGKNGLAIKKLGTDSRKKIEEMTGKKVFLELTVKIREDWRNNEQQLNKFGYNE